MDSWGELLGMWLKSKGATSIEVDRGHEYGRFTYNNRYYKWSVYQDFDFERPLNIDIGRGDAPLADGGYRGTWADIDLEVAYVDMQDPSFDPDTFFEPFKKWLLKDKVSQ